MSQPRFISRVRPLLGALLSRDTTLWPRRLRAASMAARVTARHVSSRSSVGKSGGLPAASNADGRRALDASKSRVHTAPGTQLGRAALGAADAIGGLSQVQTGGSHSLALRFTKAGSPIFVSTFWLRDSCLCDQCVSTSSGQKRYATSDVPVCPEVKSAKVAEDGSLVVEWLNDFLAGGGPHFSVYPHGFLLKHINGPIPWSFPPRRLWNRRSLGAAIKPVNYRDWVEGGAAFWRALAELHQLGIVILDGVPDSEVAVLDIAGPIGHVQSTIYGTTWDVRSKPDAENVAYTNEFLDLHQDLLYWDNMPYIQLLHCLRNDCEGGESLFSDGIKAANELELTRPEHLRPLLSTPIAYKYDRGGHLYRNTRPVLRRAGSVFQDVNWSPPFQDILDMPRMVEADSDRVMEASSIYEWRAAAKAFSDIFSASENVLECKLQPGQCVMFDNRRILHGRRQFDINSGHRWLRGAYIEKRVFASKLQQLPPGILEPAPLHRSQRTGEMTQLRQLLGLP